MHCKQVVPWLLWHVSTYAFDPCISDLRFPAQLLTSHCLSMIKGLTKCSVHLGANWNGPKILNRSQKYKMQVKRQNTQQGIQYVHNPLHGPYVELKTKTKRRWKKPEPENTNQKPVDRSHITYYFHSICLPCGKGKWTTIFHRGGGKNEINNGNTNKQLVRLFSNDKPLQGH